MFKRTVTVVLTALLVFTSAAAAPVSNEQLETISSLQIFQGDNFEEYVTRGEFCKAVCAVGGYSVQNEFEESFTDVLPQSEFYKEINTLREKGIVCGNGAGLFRPDDFITYYEAVKIAVSITGYEPLALARGGYPDGYYTAAYISDITLGMWEDGGMLVTAPLKKRNLAIMLCNAFDTPIMKEYNDDKEITYFIYNGEGKTPFVSLRTLRHLKQMDKVLGNEETAEFNYSFQNGERLYSNFLLSPQSATTSIRVKYPAAEKNHQMMVKVINKDTFETISYEKVYRVPADEEMVIMFTELEKGAEYYIELSAPSDKSASGKIEISYINIKQ